MILQFDLGIFVTDLINRFSNNWYKTDLYFAMINLKHYKRNAPQINDIKNPIKNGFTTKMLAFSSTLLSDSSTTTRWQLHRGGLVALELP